MHVVPAEALPYVQSGVLDENLFNVTLLGEQRARRRLQRPGAAAAPGPRRSGGQASPATPEAADKVQDLDSVGMVAVEGAKDEIRDVWESLRGEQADLTATDAHLAGAGKVWLNGKVRATLEDSVPQIHAPEAWAQGYDGTGATVAVLDSGYDPDAPDLEGQVKGAQDFTGTSEAAIDDNGHGTHVADIVAGTGAGSDRGEGTGVAPGAALLIGKVLDAGGSGSFDQIIAGMEWAAHSGADVVNMSLGRGATDGTDPLSQAVDRLTEETGTLFVVAAGNAGPDEGTSSTPGTAASALTVGAVDKQDAAAWFSARGPRLGRGPADQAGDRGARRRHHRRPGEGDLARQPARRELHVDERHLDGVAARRRGRGHPRGPAPEVGPRRAEGPAGVDERRARRHAGHHPGRRPGRRRPTPSRPRCRWTPRHSRSAGCPRARRRSPARSPTPTPPTGRCDCELSAQVSGTGTDAGERPEIDFTKRTLKVPAGGAGQHPDAPAAEGDRERRRTPAGSWPARSAGRRQAATVMSVAVDGPLRTLTVNGIDRKAPRRRAGRPVERRDRRVRPDLDRGRQGQRAGARRAVLGGGRPGARATATSLPPPSRRSSATRTCGSAATSLSTSTPVTASRCGSTPHWVAKWKVPVVALGLGTSDRSRSPKPCAACSQNDRLPTVRRQSTS